MILHVLQMRLCLRFGACSPVLVILERVRLASIQSHINGGISGRMLNPCVNLGICALDRRIKVERTSMPLLGNVARILVDGPLAPSIGEKVCPELFHGSIDGRNVFCALLGSQAAGEVPQGKVIATFEVRHG